MNGTIDKNLVKESFHNHAVLYDKNAKVQQKVIRQLQSIMSNHIKSNPNTILDVGCGTGRLLSDMHNLYPHAELYGVDLAENMVNQSEQLLGDSAKIVVADAEHLPFEDEKFDLLLSSSTLQWLESLQLFLNESYRVLNDGGMLFCAFFAGSTLHELHECYRDVIINRCGENDSRLGRLHHFHVLGDVKRVLGETLFEQVVLTTEEEVEEYSTLQELLRSIHNVGAGSSTSGKLCAGGLGWRGLLREMNELYHTKYGKNGVIPARYEICYIVARKIS